MAVSIKANKLTRELRRYIRENAGYVYVEVWVKAERDHQLSGVLKGDFVCPDCGCLKGHEHDEHCHLGEIIAKLKDVEIARD